MRRGLLALMLLAAACGLPDPTHWKYEGEYGASILDPSSAVAGCYAGVDFRLGDLTGGVTLWADSSRGGDPLGIDGDWNLCGGRLSGGIFGHINHDDEPELWIPSPWGILRIYACAGSPASLVCRMSGAGMDGYTLRLTRWGVKQGKVPPDDAR